jgi:hypothetical protein
VPWSFIYGFEAYRPTLQVHGRPGAVFSLYTSTPTPPPPPPPPPPPARLLKGENSCHGGHRVGRGRCWTSHAVRFADNTILSYLINVVPSIQCCVPVFSSGLRSAVRRRLTSGRTVVSVVRINSDIIGELTRQHCVHFYGSYAFRTSYR